MWRLRTAQADVSEASRSEVSRIPAPSVANQDFDESRVPEIVQQILRNRGLGISTAWGPLFSPRLADLQSPWKLRDIEAAVERLVFAHQRRETICLYADFDLDGTSGLGLALDGFRALGFEKVLPVQPLRLSEGYGFHGSIVEKLAAKNVNVIVTIDVGITALTAASIAKDLGIDVIITDHHQPGAELPDARAVVNPNCRDCESGLGYLCGAGVIFYLLRALKRRLVEKGLVAETALNLLQLLDYLTIATLTDMVPLVADNRILVKHGLRILSETRRPGLRALLDRLRLSGKLLTAQDVAIRFAPKLNALSRMETGIRPLDVYLAPTIEDAENLVETVLEMNSERVSLQSMGESLAIKMAEEYESAQFVFARSREFHRGVVGLIATKLASAFGKPAFVCSEGEDSVLVGSARAPQGGSHSVLRALEAATEALNRFGGHNPAAGFELHLDKEAEFLNSLHKHFSSASAESTPETEFDGDLSIGDVTPGLIRWLEALGPFGARFPAPLFCFRHVRILEAKRMKGQHLRLTVSQNAGAPIVALYFSPPPNFDVSAGQVLHILGEIQKNDFRRVIEPQILVREVEFVSV